MASWSASEGPVFRTLYDAKQRQVLRCAQDANGFLNRVVLSGKKRFGDRNARYSTEQVF